MSRTTKGSKGPGHEYWGRRPGPREPSPWAKTTTHRLERRQEASVIRGEEAMEAERSKFSVTEAETGKTLFLFEVDDGSSSWVLAYDSQDALVVYIEAICDPGLTLDEAREEMGWVEDPEVGQICVDRAEEYVFHDDDNVQRSMAEQCRREPVRGLVASSEW